MLDVRAARSTRFLAHARNDSLCRGSLGGERLERDEMGLGRVRCVTADVAPRIWHLQSDGSPLIGVASLLRLVEWRQKAWPHNDAADLSVLAPRAAEPAV